MTVLGYIPALLATTAPVLDPEPGFWMPEQGSTLAPTVDWMFMLITWICAIFFVGIVGFEVYFMFKYRRRSHVIDTGGVTHNTPLEVTWSVIPLILVIAIFYIGMKGFLHIRQPPAGAYEVYVTAQKWSWSFQHRSGVQDVVLDVPAGRPVKLIMSSNDVLHALFIPAFRVKQDVIPGRQQTLWFEVPPTDEHLEYDLFCAEYCGQQHSKMITRVNVIPEAEFDAYMTEKAAIFEDLQEHAPELMGVYAANRIYPLCVSCHSVDGSTLTGPSFQGLWQRVENREQVFTDGSSLADHVGDGRAYAGSEDYIQQSMLNPQKHIVSPFTGAMPTFQGQLSQAKINAMIQFFKEFDSIVDAEGNIQPAPPMPTGDDATP